MSDSTEFVDQEDAYRQWLRAHPTGFVLNTTRTMKPAYMVLHRSTCHSISDYTGNAAEGGFTARQYIKVCAPSVDALSQWVATHGRPDGSFSKRCQSCGA